MKPNIDRPEACSRRLSPSLRVLSSPFLSHSKRPILPPIFFPSTLATAANLSLSLYAPLQRDFPIHRILIVSQGTKFFLLFQGCSPDSARRRRLHSLTTQSDFDSLSALSKNDDSRRSQQLENRVAHLPRDRTLSRESLYERTKRRREGTREADLRRPPP